MYILLDGHLRLEVLKELGQTSARCLISTDDEAYTYNKRVSKLATVQEHVMVLNAIRDGHVAEDRIAKALNLDIASIRRKRDLLVGIGHEAAEVLKNRNISPNVFAALKKMKPMRQLEVAELLVATNNLSVPYTKALLAATPTEMLVDPDKRKVIEGLTPEQIAKMEKEMDSLQRDLKLIEASHGNEVLNLVLARGYLAKLFGNARVVRYLAQNFGDIFRELQAIVEATSLGELTQSPIWRGPALARRATRGSTAQITTAKRTGGLIDLYAGGPLANFRQQPQLPGSLKVLGMIRSNGPSGKARRSKHSDCGRRQAPAERQDLEVWKLVLN